VPINSVLDFWDNQGRIFLEYGRVNDNISPAFTYEAIFIFIKITEYISIIDEKNIYTANTNNSWYFNNNTNIIPTTIVQNADGLITMSYSGYEGRKYSYTFTGW
jgi:hypothetical protein